MKKNITKIFESNAFIFVTAIIFIAFGLYYWGDFSRNVDNIASEFLHKQVKHSAEIGTSIEKAAFINFLTSYYNENIYEFKEFSNYYQSREFSEGDSLKYFFLIPKIASQNIILSVKYTSLPKDFDIKKHSQNCSNALQKLIYEK